MPKIILLFLVFIVVIGGLYIAVDYTPEPRIELGPVVFERLVITESEDILTIEEFECEFTPPIKHITLIMHYYPNYAMLNEEYWNLNPDDDDEVWGWSACIWQPEDDWAACDVYLKIPDTVVDVDDYAIETAGHENWHAACGNFHK